MNFKKQLDKIRNGNQGGYIIIEAMVGITVFAISMSGLALMLSASAKATDISRGVAEQTSIGGDVIENLLTFDYHNDDELDPGGKTLAIGGMDPRYTVTTQVGQDTYLRNTKIVSVSVTNNEGGQNKTTTIDYIIPDTI